jgi:uroporphyrin-III C-methyltransferase/precorrin-2 dehydrogenase/sirohydrochlorin ferrochelatase
MASVDAPVYPVGLRLAGRRVVVVGAGAVAGRRVRGLLAAAADVVVIAPEASEPIVALDAAGELRWVRRHYQDGDLTDAWYAVAATDDTAVNAAVAGEADRLRVFCVRADHASLASAWTPASGRHEGVTVSVLADRDPGRAAVVRDAVLDQLRTGSIRAPRVRGRLAGVALVGGGPGDPDLITVRGRRLLAEADVVVVDRLAPRALLAELSPRAEVVDAAKIPYGRAMAQQEINRIIVEHALAGKFVVRLKGGDSFVFGRGYEEVIACAEAGVPCRVVPGVTSAVGVPAVVGVPVTHRGVAHEFTVVSGHAAPDDPDCLVDYAALGRLRGTLVLLMAVERIGVIADALLAGGRPADTPAVVIQDGTNPDERVLTATLGTVASVVAGERVRPPAIIVVGPVVALRSQGALARS